ncbi:protein pitchfork [Kryptolebias marmoratus]|uniref:Primary cilia formation n=1 Tax=Kryptolebias marmoratus TaxID=37003 RepID=A0A3Q2ZWI2_KRYMA|nr:protein pitchfork [Kryptolebias marmoratus]
MSAVPSRRVVFSSSQERRLFPLHFAPDRLGNQHLRHDAPHLGPGCYDNHKFGTIIYELEKKPESKRGHGLSARTAARFPPCNKTVTPSPQQYQQDHSKSRVTPPGKTPFNSTALRFKSTQSTANSPGPGTYNTDVMTNKKVKWPMCFGSPDWSQLAQLEKKSLRVKLTSDKEFVKQRNRLAYLSLYF